MAPKRGRIIALVSSKGGAGKTTLACCLAAELLERGHPVALVDTDPQAEGGTAQWHRAGGPLAKATLYTEPSEKAAAIARDAASEGAVVLVDAAGTFTRTTIAILAAADVAVIPCRPSGLDAMRALEMVAAVRQAGSAEPVVVLSAVGRSALPEHIRKELKKAGANVMRPEIGNRVAYATAALYGSAPVWMGSDAQKAREEVSAVADVLMRL